MKKTKHLLLVNSRLDASGGIETLTKQVARAYRSAGWAVTSLNLRCTYVGDREGIYWIGLMPKGWLAYRVCVRLRHLLARRWLKRHLSDYDLVVSSHEQFASTIQSAAERYKVPYVVMLHGLEVWRPLPSRTVEALRHANALVHVSEFTRDEVIRRFAIKDANFVKISPCVDLEEFDVEVPQLTSEHNSSVFHLLTVGRLNGVERDKGHRLVIRALRVLKDRGANAFKYKIVGDGPDRAALEAFAVGQGIADRVEFLGRVSNEDMVRAYHECDLFLLPAPLQRLDGDRLSGEGFGIVYLEAGACRKPVIGGDEGGCVDPVRDGVNGFRCPQDPEILADRVEQLKADPELCRRLGAAGHTLGGAEYSYEVFANKWLELANLMPTN